MNVKPDNYSIGFDGGKISFGKLTSNRSILALFKIIFNRNFNEDLLKWFAACPTGSNCWYGAFDGDEPVGMYGLLPIKIKIGQDVYHGALCNNVGVIPRFFGRGLFQALGKYALGDAGFPVVVCVSNAQAVRGHKAIGWENYGELELLSGDSRSEDIDFVGFDKFKYITCKRESSFYVVKDFNYMKWRYSKPGEEYFQSFFGGEDYAIWKKYKGKKQVLEASDWKAIYKLSGIVDIWQFKDSDASVQLKNNGFSAILSNEFLVYSGLTIDKRPNFIKFETGDNDVF